MSNYVGIRAPGGKVRHWKSVTDDAALCGWIPTIFELVRFPNANGLEKCSRCDLLKNRTTIQRLGDNAVAGKEAKQ